MTNTIDKEVYHDTVARMLKTCDSPVLADHVIATQKDLKQTLKCLQPSWSHTFSKTAVGFTAGAAAIVIPTALLGMAVQSAATASCTKFEEHFFDICKKIDLTKHIEYFAESVGDSTGILSAVLTSTAGVTLLAGFSAFVAAIDSALKNKKLSAATAAMTLFYMAKKTANFATKGFTAQEAKLGGIREDVEKDARSALEAYFNGLSEALHERFMEAKESPEKLNELKLGVSNLLDQCEEATTVLPSIAGIKIDHLKKLTSLAKTILAYEITLRADASDQYNWEVMMTTPVNEFAKKCLPQSTKEFFHKAKESPSSWFYEIKRVTHSSVKGLVGGVVIASSVAAAVLAGMHQFSRTTYDNLWLCNDERCKVSNLGVASGVAASAVLMTAGLVVANRVNDSYDKLTERRRKEIALAASSSRKELRNIYQGISSQLKKYASKLTVYELSDIAKKLKIAENEMGKYISPQEAQNIFKPLRAQLSPTLTSIAIAY